MIIGADWLLTGAGDPIRDGAVLTRGSRVEAAGSFAALVVDNPGEATEFFNDCVLMPGLVNAHTHLSLSVLKGLLAPEAMAPWLRKVTRAVHALGDDDFAASASLGALECLQCGVTSVGDIAYGPEALAAAADAGVGGVFYWEVLGLEAGDLSGELADREFPTEVGMCNAGRTRCGVSPHAPYSSGPELLRAVHTVARRHKVGFAVHVAESEAERDLMLYGEGPFADAARRLAPDFTPPRSSSVAYLSSLGVLDDALAIHCVHLQPGDIPLLKSKTRGVVLCPRSNAYLRNGKPPVSELYAANVKLALGTDSTASNSDLDIMEEARALRTLASTITARRLIRMVTRDAARALGLHDEIGTLEPGKQADVALFRIGPVTDPEAAVVRSAGRDALEAVMTAGVWRVREGRPSFPTAAIERAAARARAKAEAAVAGS